MFLVRNRRWLLFSSILCFIGGCSIGSWITIIFYQLHLEDNDTNSHHHHNSLSHNVLSSNLLNDNNNNNNGEYNLSPDGKILGEEIAGEQKLTGEAEAAEEEEEDYEETQSSSSKSLLLVILIMSAPTNFNQRETIRSTWLKLLRSPTPTTKVTSTKYYFLIGTANLNLDLKLKLEQEQLKYQDLLLLRNLHDNFLNLTSKLIQGINFLHTSSNLPNYLLKCDDDSFVRINIVLNELQTRQNTDKSKAKSDKKKCFYWGFFDGRAKVLKVGKWQELDYNLCDLYIPYALGGGYIINYNCIEFIITNSKRLKQYKNEDVSIGTWLSIIGPEYKHDIRFDTEFRSRGCNNNYIIQHKIKSNEMYEKYLNLININKLCTIEYQNRSSYEYNWNNLPSKCCKRNSTII